MISYGTQCCFLQNQIKDFLNTLISKRVFELMKINSFRGELTDILATKQLLAVQHSFTDFFSSEVLQARSETSAYYLCSSKMITEYPIIDVVHKVHEARYGTADCVAF